MKKREALEKGLLDAQYRSKSESEKEAERIELRKEAARPALLKRIGAGLLDFLFTAIFAGLMFVFAYYVIFPNMGYQDYSEKIVAAYSGSGLYISANGRFNAINNMYDDEKTPEENYDEPITHFYSTNSRAIEDNKLESYEQTKLNSGYYEINGEGSIVRKEGVSTELAKEFLEARYKEAATYLFSDPAILNAYEKSRNIMLFSTLIIISIASASFYFLVPAIDKDGCSLGYVICRLIPVSSVDTNPQTKGKLMLRSLIFIAFTYLAPITLYFLANGFTFSFIPFFVNTAILCFSRSNSGLHDYATRTIIINRSRTNAMQALKQLKGEQDE